MSLSAATVWEVRTAGNDANGGGFVAGASGTDYSQQDSAQYSFTDLASTNGTGGSPVVTSASHNFVSADVGNILHVNSGTNWTAGYYQIVSCSSNAATLDRACATSASVTAGTYRVGGALGSPGGAGGASVAGNVIYVKSGTYNINTSTTNITSGCISLPASPNSSNVGMLIGYSSSRTDRGVSGRPLLQAVTGVSQPGLVTLLYGTLAANITTDGGSFFNAGGFNGVGVAFINCKASNCPGAYFQGGQNATLWCEASGDCTFQAHFQGYASFCVSHGNTTNGFGFQSSAAVYYCVAYSDKVGFFQGNYTNGAFVGCTAYGNTQDGFKGDFQTGFSTFSNCISYGNSGYGFNFPNAAGFLQDCAAGSNTSGAVNGSPLQYNLVALTGNPFNNAAGGDFSLNNTAGAGAACRGISQLWPGGNMTSYLDMGPIQHQDTPSVNVVINQSINKYFSMSEADT